jgi:hypothetical protein
LAENPVHEVCDVEAERDDGSDDVLEDFISGFK